MKLSSFLLSALLAPVLLAQAPEAAAASAVPAATTVLPEIGLLDAKGTVVTLVDVKMKSSSTTTIPFSGVKTKIKFEKPAALPKVIPSKCFLGKLAADKGGAIHLARLVPDGDILLLKGKFPMKLAIHPPFQALDESVPSKEPLKETVNPQGVRVVEFTTPLEPGVYILVRASASKGFTGLNSEAAGAMFEVPLPEPTIKPAQ